IGVNNKNKNAYLMLGNPAWRSLEVGKEYSLVLQFDDEGPWEGKFTAVNMDGPIALVIQLSESKFFREFAAKQSLSIQYRQNPVTNLPLRGTFSAMRSLIECQGKVNEAAPSTPPRADPFAGSTTRHTVVDPFQSTY